MSAPAQFRWLRLWTDIIDDEKLLLLSPDDRWYYIAILALKRSGMLDVDESADMRDRKVSLKLRLDHRERDEVKRRLQDVALIDADWQPLGWDKRQFQSDQDSTAADRQRRHREKQRNGSVTRDTGVTSRTSHGRVTRPDTDTDTDTETEKNPHPPDSRAEPPAGLDLAAWDRWMAYRVEIRKPIKPASLLAAQRKLAGFGAEQAAAVEQSVAQGWTGLFAPKHEKARAEAVINPSTGRPMVWT